MAKVNGHEKLTEPASLHVMTLSIIFCESKRLSIKKLTASTKKLAATPPRHSIAVQKSLTRTELPQKAQSYNSENLFSFHQEDTKIAYLIV